MANIKDQLGSSPTEQAMPTLAKNSTKRNKSRTQKKHEHTLDVQRLARIEQVLDAMPDFDDDLFAMSAEDREKLSEIKLSALERVERYKPPRPSDLGLRRIQAILLSLEGGASVTKACAAVGTSCARFYLALEADQDLMRVFEVVQDAKALIVGDCLYDAATDKTTYGHVTAMIFYLKNRQSNRWNDKPSPRERGRSTMTDADLQKRILELTAQREVPRLPIVDAGIVQTGAADTGDTPE